jgi:hypothetical protein
MRHNYRLLNLNNLFKQISLFCLLLVAQTLIINAAIPLKTDRWLEIDLYWFEHKEMEKSVNQFWDRFYPLMEGLDGWKGVILNVGWTSDYILEWHGDLNETIKFPKNMKKWPSFKDEGQFSGNTIDRIQLWKDRFSKADKPQVINYEAWTYADLKKLSDLIKKVAFKKYRLTDVMVGTFVLGFESIYDGDKTEFAKTHPNAYLNNAPNLLARLGADSNKYGAFPLGITEGIPLTEFFGKQWGNLSKRIDLDVIVFRDSYLGVGIYARTGPYGKAAPSDPEKVKNWSNATADLIRLTKISNPKALVIGYSNAASAVADWRINCFDLEAIAKEGYLDGWIDQTWAGAWNEVGQRPESYWNILSNEGFHHSEEFWNNQLLGWTYQLSYVLGHAAVLADTKVHHYFLTETFDAWESWDIIHNARERLRWGIWAFSHAAVKKPDGLKMPAGSYISWCNQAKNLLSEEDVAFLAETSNAAIRDARETTKILGPTLVYCRSAIEWQSMNKPNETIGEWIDEQAGTLIKWSVPILSITRSEYLPQVESDMFIFQTPVHLKKSEKSNIIKILDSDKSAAVFASPAGGLDSDISAILGVSTVDTAIIGTKYIGTINYKTDQLFNALPNTFPIFQPFTKNIIKDGVEEIYSVNNSPCLTYNGLGGKHLIFWNAPEFSKNLQNDSGNYGESLDQILGSPTPYVLTARLINEDMKKNGLIYADYIEQYHPLNLAMWKLNDGSYRVMAGNLEEGINHTADLSVQTVLNIPGLNIKSKSTEIIEIWNGEKLIVGNKKLFISLNQAQTKLFTFK